MDKNIGNMSLKPKEDVCWDHSYDSLLRGGGGGGGGYWGGGGY